MRAEQDSNMKARSRYSREGVSDRERRTGGRNGTFVAASLAGWVAAFFCVSCTQVPFIAMPLDYPVARALLLCLSCFVGGFFSGWILESDLEPHGWKVLWLAAASPALPVWLLAALFAGIGAEIDQAALLIISVVCAASLAGALVGHWFGHRLRIAQKRYPPLSSTPTEPTERTNVTENTARRENGQCFRS